MASRCGLLFTFINLAYLVKDPHFRLGHLFNILKSYKINNNIKTVLLKIKLVNKNKIIIKAQRTNFHITILFFHKEIDKLILFIIKLIILGRNYQLI